MCVQIAIICNVQRPHKSDTSLSVMWTVKFAWTQVGGLLNSLTLLSSFLFDLAMIEGILDQCPLSNHTVLLLVSFFFEKTSLHCRFKHYPKIAQRIFTNFYKCLKNFKRVKIHEF